MRKWLIEGFGRNKVAYIFVLTVLVFGGVSVVLIPPFWGLDETQHFNRAFQVSELKLVPVKTSSAYGGTIPRSVIESQNEWRRDLINNSQEPILERKDVDNNREQRELLNQPLNTEKNEIDFAGSATYNPISYIAPASSIVTARVLNLNVNQTLILARLVSLLVYTSVVFFALTLLRPYKSKWLVVIVALLPVSIFEAATVNADSLLYAVSLLLFGSIVAVLNSKSKSTLAKKAMIVSALLIPLLKINYIFLSFVTTIMPKEVAKKADFRVRLKRWIIPIIVILLSLLWLWLARGVASNVGSSLRGMNETISISGQMSAIIHNPILPIKALIATIIKYGDMYFYGLTGRLAWNWMPIPMAVVFLAYLMILIAVIFAKEEFAKHKMTYRKSLWLSLFGIAGILATFYLTYSPVGSTLIEGLQGRYFIPFIPFIGAAISPFIPVSLKISKNKEAVLFFGSSIVALIVSTLFYFVGTY